MTPAEAMQKLLRSYQTYYTLKTEDVEAPFAAEAVFHSLNDQYFLVRRAVLSESESNEYVYFAVCDNLTLDEVQSLDERAWERGVAHADPHPNHRNTDVVLMIFAETIAPEARDFIRKSRHYKSYKFTLQGWSDYSLIAMETSSGDLLCNNRGKNLKKLFRNTGPQTGRRKGKSK